MNTSYIPCRDGPRRPSSIASNSPNSYANVLDPYHPIRIEIDKALVQIYKVQKALDSNFQSASMSEISCEGLCDMLLMIARFLARVNSVRIEQAGALTAVIPELEGIDKQDLCEIVKFGIYLAESMQRKMAMTPDGDTTSSFDVFISYPGKEEGFLYAPCLEQKLKEQDLTVFLDKTGLVPGSTGRSNKTTIFRTLWGAEVWVCVCTLATLQKPWPLAEILCALSRPEKIIFDCMPGHVWMAAPASGTHSRRTNEWCDDVKSLLGVGVPAMVPCDSPREGIAHMAKIVDYATSARVEIRDEEWMAKNAAYNNPNAPTTIAWHALGKSEITETEFRDALISLSGDQRKSFLVRKSDRRIHMRRADNITWRKQRPAVIYYLKAPGKIAKEYWYYDGDENKFVWFRDLSQRQKETTLVGFDRFSGLLVEFGCFTFFITNMFRDPDLTAYMVKAGEEARLLLEQCSAARRSVGGEPTPLPAANSNNTHDSCDAHAASLPPQECNAAGDETANSQENDPDDDCDIHDERLNALEEARDSESWVESLDPEGDGTSEDYELQFFGNPHYKHDR